MSPETESTPVLPLLKETVPAKDIEGTPYILVQPRGKGCSIEVNGQRYGGKANTVMGEDMTDRQTAAVKELYAAFTE